MSETTETTTCPVCGKAAEIGALYSRGSFDWIPGKPNWKKRFADQFLLAGETIGNVGLFLASHVKATRCRSCNHITIYIEPRKNYFPDVKE
jgi:hypothetical protein